MDAVDLSSEETLARLKATAEAKAEASRRRKENAQRAKELDSWGDDCDDTFAYIVGHTSGGAPYGVTWEEMDEKSQWQDEDALDAQADKDDYIPF